MGTEACVSMWVCESWSVAAGGDRGEVRGQESGGGCQISEIRSQLVVSSGEPRSDLSAFRLRRTPARQVGRSAGGGRLISLPTADPPEAEDL